MSSNTQPTPSDGSHLINGTPFVNGVPPTLHHLYDLCNLALSSFDSFVFLVSVAARSPEVLDEGQRRTHLSHLEPTTRMLDYALRRLPSAREAVVNSSEYEQYKQTASCIMLIFVSERLPTASMAKVSSMVEIIEKTVLREKSLSEEALDSLCDSREDLALSWQDYRSCIDDVRQVLEDREV